MGRRQRPGIRPAEYNGAGVDADGSSGLQEPSRRLRHEAVAGFRSGLRASVYAAVQRSGGLSGNWRGPVGIDSLAVAIGEERGTLEEVVEPFLIQSGFLNRTSRGRVATRMAWTHFGLKAPATDSRQSGVFDSAR